MSQRFLADARARIGQLREDGFYKSERVIASQQSARVRLAGGAEVLNFCANNYLGLANDPRLIRAAAEGLAADGFGLASVRFICGTQTGHKALEAELARWLGMGDAILYSSCFDANGGLFEALLDEQDAIVSDALNHASIIDGIRLCKARRYRYANNDMADLRAQLQAARDGGARHVMIATDGVFSMDGIVADLAAICDLADEFDALVMVDDSHAVGFMGAGGRGTPEHCGVAGRVHILTGTLGKALGGASGGYVAADPVVVELLRQRSRPYLFSNTLAPAIVAASRRVVELLQDDEGAELRARVHRNGAHFRREMQALGFDLVPGEHPIIPVMLGDAALAGRMADALLEQGIYVIGFSYPVVPKGRARIRTQMSAAHAPEDIDRAVQAFARVGRDLGVIG
ncbi:glycine C-acetyltransferase [Castellaniella defragrans]|uniref:2-amino-3-ketobutyrate coenzyme A ligase n=1 Tax=Castellaniella defragrans TaxID=75697 RepID=A0A7W9WM03_CASDE|nr:glycine C-acetyltransferase [Castellaniella defragrans]KAB0622661.1 glycine C-acetyltransferase [Castellaniella defragrans]MBB6082008.1 glycine C-acetyltransferase [Castellaniella defragrans]